MTDEEKKKMKELEDANKKLADDLKKATDSVTKLTETVKEKDLIIDQKNTDIISTRKSYKKLEDMTKEEKDQLSQAEKELMERTEAHEAEVARFQKEQQERQQKEVAERRSNAIKKLVGENPDLAKKVAENFERINGFDKAITESEIAKIAGDAFNLLGDEKPAPVADAMNNNGDAPGDSNKGGTSDERIKQIATEMGLPAEAPADGGNGAGV